jgi:hypothetical protein
MNTDFFKDNWHYINISECLKQSTLFKTYHKTSKQDCQFFFVLLWAKLTNQITEKDFNKELLKRNLAFEEIENNDSIVSGRFELETKKTFIRVSTGLEKLIKENIKSKVDAVAYNQLEKLSDFYWHNFVHEDTHKQQAKVTPLKFFNNYVTYDTDPFDLKSIQNVKYFNQPFEADAFGRELGSILAVEYELKDSENEFSRRNTVHNIFQDLKDGKVEDDFVKSIWNTYKDPRISEKAQRSFIRALYDFLEGFEVN